jgi:flagellar biogenesis protein FliO
MLKLTRSLTAAGVLSLAACACQSAAGDYPDYAPSPPPADAERGAGLLSEAELNRPVDAPRAADGRRAQDVTWGADPLRQSEPPRPATNNRNLEPANTVDPARGEIPPAETVEGSRYVDGAEPTSPRPLPQQYRPIEPGITLPAKPSQVRLVSERLPEAEPIPLARENGEARSSLRGGDIPPFVTGAASLAIVVGLFLLVAWVVRRGMPKNLPVLPREAVEMLGRAPLVGRQQVHLVRCGNKVLLLSVSPAHVETLTEIDDPDEVARLVGACQPAYHGAAAHSFRQVYDPYARAPRDGEYLMTEEVDELDYAQLDPISRRRAQESRG